MSIDHTSARSQEFVSIVMPAYNAAAYISASIRSVLEQSHECWELIVIDDASMDDTPEIVKRYSREDDRIKLHPLPTNQGTGFARNIGIKASKGRFISFLDADDLWQPEKLGTQLNFMKKHDAGVCYSSYELMDEQGREQGRIVQALEELPFSVLLRANYIGNLTGIYDTEKVGKIYCPLIRKRQDWGLWLLAVQKIGTAKGIREPLAKYRVRKNSISGNKFEMLGYNYLIYRTVLKFSAIKSTWWMVCFLWEQFFVKRRRIVSSI